MVDVNSKTSTPSAQQLGTKDENPYETAVELQHQSPASEIPETRNDFDDGFKPVINKYQIFSNTSSASSEIGDNNSDKASVKDDEKQPSEEDKERYRKDLDEMINECEENVRKMEYEGTLKRSRKILDANFAQPESHNMDV